MLREEQKLSKHWLGKGISSKQWLLILIALLLVLGIFFRVINLDKKPVWDDEAHTFSVISGYSDLEVIEKFPAATSVSVGDFLKYQYPNSERGLADVLKKLYTDVHPPFYFLTARFWVEQFGHSIAALRSVSVFFSILALPCIYWLCLELFEMPSVGYMAMVLLSVSPFQILYAQENRPYSLFTLVVLLSGALLLQALKNQNKFVWLVYAASVALGIYSQLFFVLVLLGYTVYVFAIESFRFTKRFFSFLFATFLGFIAFLPWFVTLLLNFSHFQEKSSWIKDNKLTILGAVRLWSENISLSFIDPWASEYFGIGRFSLYFLIPFILGLVGYSIYILFRKIPKHVYLFVFTLIGSTAVPLIVADAVLGGNRQIWPRYLVPCFLGFQLSVAHLLATHAFPSDLVRQNKKRKFWTLTTVALITSSIIFCTIISQANSWWNKYDGQLILNLTQQINQSKSPLLVVNREYPRSVLYFSLSPNVLLQFVGNEKLDISILEKNHDVFLLNPTMALRMAVEQNGYNLETIYKNSDSISDRVDAIDLFRVK
ncbi:MAG: glycosyltransferase family 39 protein [Oscillatoriales cyanobacterium C42_A2020_001]|nr:glycosyltransferase family 39 protein [Leptolyngbyaceae cyanobacterium C42_A2020_001]